MRMSLGDTRRACSFAGASGSSCPPLPGSRHGRRDERQEAELSRENDERRVGQASGQKSVLASLVKHQIPGSCRTEGWKWTKSKHHTRPKAPNSSKSAPLLRRAIPACLPVEVHNEASAPPAKPGKSGAQGPVARRLARSLPASAVIGRLGISELLRGSTRQPPHIHRIPLRADN
jgi:hypothetical protein